MIQQLQRGGLRFALLTHTTDPVANHCQPT